MEDLTKGKPEGRGRVFSDAERTKNEGELVEEERKSCVNVAHHRAVTIHNNNNNM